jgi:hypothetical protein
VPEQFPIDVIRPLSVVQLISEKPQWLDQKGSAFRVGYYRLSDGLDCVWLVDSAGTYCQTTDQQSIRDDFSVVSLSQEDDLYGVNKAPLGPTSAYQPIVSW